MFLIGIVILLITLVLFVICFVKVFLFFFLKHRFPKKLLASFLTGMLLVSGIWVYKQYFFSFNQLHGSHYQGGAISPNGKYSADAYGKSFGGAAGGIMVWVKIKDHQGQKSKTIYYSGLMEHFSMQWKDNDHLKIINDDSSHLKFNNNVVLDVRSEIYDETGQACRSLLMKKDYKTCLQN